MSLPFTGLRDMGVVASGIGTGNKEATEQILSVQTFANRLRGWG